jgi:hypothetical protein
MDEVLKNYGSEIKTVLQDKRNQEILAIVGAVYLLSRDNKQRNAIVSGLAALAFLPDKTKEADKQ